ncbi:MAG: prepilin-type N-terminal cleavage/methylation domain-containing protein [Oscillospiraceae bacterium]|nr:prepilin-type N-terminal cleavage/methylation domain-containing protein [Oscillospiraceae bacterium]
MKKNLKGFTLIECLIALAILGIASLVMAQIYANVSKINRANHETNSSIAYQMKYVEQKTKTAAIKVPSGEVYVDVTNKKVDTQPPHKRTGATINQIKIKKVKTTTYTDEFEYSYPVDYFILQSRDQNGEAAYIWDDVTKTWKTNNLYKGTREDDYYLNYKYLLGYSID